MAYRNIASSKRSIGSLNRFEPIITGTGNSSRSIPITAKIPKLFNSLMLVSLNSIIELRKWKKRLHWLKCKNQIYNLEIS